MEALWRWTPSVFLILELCIGETFSQNVAPNYLLPQQTLQDELLRDSNPELVNSRKINNVIFYPPNGMEPGVTALVLESPQQAFQDRLCTQCPPNQQALQACQSERTDIMPISQIPFNNVDLTNAQSACADSGPAYNIPGQLLPFPQPTPQNQYPIGPPTCLPQQSEMLPPQDSLLPLSNGLLPIPSLCSHVEAKFYPNSLPYVNNRLLDPVVENGLPCKDVMPPQRVTIPSSPAQNISPMCPALTQIIPVNSQGTSVDVCSPGPTQCLSTFNGSPPNSFLSLPSKLPIQGPIPPCSPINNLSQSVALGSQCDILPETPACPSAAALPSPIGAKLQSFLPFSPFNMLKFPRLNNFQPGMPFQGVLSSSLPCGSNTNTATQASICANPALIQQNPTTPQVPIAPATFMPNLLPKLPFPNGELFPFQSFPISQPLLNSGFRSFAPDITSISSLPPAIIPQSCAIPPNGFGGVLPQVTNFVDYSIKPLNLFPPCVESTSAPTLPTSILGSSVLDAVPKPIYLQINVPPPVIPPARIIIINTTPVPDATVSTNTEEQIDFPNSLPPMIIERRRSRSRSWLPLILVALFTRDGDFGGYGGGCSCDPGPIPIPYPIPIPTNNPVIVNN